jgi:hypothetical protein
MGNNLNLLFASSRNKDAFVQLPPKQINMKSLLSGVEEGHANNLTIPNPTLSLGGDQDALEKFQSLLNQIQLT